MRREGERARGAALREPVSRRSRGRSAAPRRRCSGPVTVILPAWLLNIHRPMMSAIGIVMPMVKTPHGLFASALTTTMPSPASVTSRMNSTAIIATSPANGLISVRAMSASERPAMAHRGDQHGEVLHASGQHRADQEPEKSRRKSELRRQRRAHQRPGAGDGGKVMSEQHPLRRGHIVVPVFIGVRRSDAAVVERPAPWRR